MFDEILRPNKPRATRRQAWLWIGSSVLDLLLGASFIARHRDIGWLMVAAGTFVLLTGTIRLVACWQDDAQEKQTEKLNG
jgi:hypothetical protein